MLDTLTLETLPATLIKWFSENILTTNTLYQGLLILSAFIIGGLAYRILRKKIQTTIDRAPLPAAANRILSNLGRLTYPLITVLILFIGVQITSTESFKIDTTITQAIMKVVFAWIVIRTIVQFISNKATRNFFTFVIWTIAALSIFGILDQTMSTLDAFAFSIGDFRLSALAVIKSILLIFTLLYFALFASSFGEKKVMEVKSLSRSSQVLISKILRVTLIVFALLIGITSAGIDLSLFAVFGGAIGLGIGFGLQKGISNLFSGMLLLMDRSIKPGDVIEIPDIGTFGWVNHMAARYTEIVTRDNKSFLIPNEDFITQRVVNWSHGNSLIRVQIAFGVHYDSDMEQVIEIACQAAQNVERVVDHRAPVCWMTEFGDSSVNFSLRFWIKDAQEGMTNVRGQVMMELWKAFKEHNIQIPYPHREVYVRDGK